MKETLIVGNHPDSTKLIPHILRLAAKNDVVLLSTTTLAAFLGLLTNHKLEVLPITQHMPGKNKVNEFLMQSFLGVYQNAYGELKVPADPISKVADILAHEHRNVLLFPSGKVQKDTTKPEPWKSGVGRITRKAYEQNPDLKLAYLRVWGYFLAEMSEPFPITSAIELPMQDSSEHVDGKILSKKIADSYHRYYEIGDHNFDRFLAKSQTEKSKNTELIEVSNPT